MELETKEVESNIIDPKVIDAMIKRLNIYNTMIKDMDNRILELEGIKNPQNLWGKIQDLYNQLETLATDMSLAIQRLNIMDLDEKYLEIFSDQDINNFYEQSGLSLQEIKTNIVNKYIDKEVELPTVHRYVTGQTEDLKIRSIIGKKLREHALIKNKQCKNKK